jgi:hypothetical protein
MEYTVTKTYTIDGFTFTFDFTFDFDEDISLE